MSLLTQLVDPSLFARLGQEDLVKLAAVLEAELLRNTDVHQLLRSRIDEYVPYIEQRLQK